MERRVAVVVEDDDDIRALTAELLGQSGFTVHQAASGSAGVQAVRTHAPTVVTVDLGLPDFDGYEVTRRVRRISDAYVVMLTARTEEIDTLLGLEAGADDYITKPFRPRELRARIEAMLRRPRSTGPVPGDGRGPDSVASSAAVASPAAAAVPPVPGPPAGADAPTAPPQPATPAAIPAGDVCLELDGLQLYPALHQVLADGREVPLTPSEFLLLETLMSSGRVVRAKEALARIVRGEDADSGTFVSQADERTVEVHLGNLRRKLADDPKDPRWVVTVRGVGYRMAGRAERVR